MKRCLIKQVVFGQSGSIDVAGRFIVVSGSAFLRECGTGFGFREHDGHQEQGPLRGVDSAAGVGIAWEKQRFCFFNTFSGSFYLFNTSSNAAFIERFKGDSDEEAILFIYPGNCFLGLCFSIFYVQNLIKPRRITMSNQEDFLAKQAVLSAIPDSDIVLSRNMPLAMYIFEAEALNKWCQDDRPAFETISGLWDLVEDLPVRAGALRELESIWRKERFTRDEAAQRWATESPELFEFRKELMAAFRYAFRDNDSLLGRVDSIAKGITNAEKLQNLNDLAVLGRANQDLLTAIAFDLTQLDDAAAKADEMSEVYAIATAQRKGETENRKLRDKAYVHLKEAVDEIYSAGKYLLRGNRERLRGYTSAYLSKRKNKPGELPEPTPAPVVEPVVEPIAPAPDLPIDLDDGRAA